MKNQIKCMRCPYKLGIIKTLVNPCPQCMANNYDMLEKFLKKLSEAKNGDKKKKY